MIPSLAVTAPDSADAPVIAPGGIPADIRDDPALAERALVVTSVLGAGGHSIVYRARDDRHAREVAIKVLREESRLDRGAERFAQEIRVAAGLRHPHILPLYDSGSLRDGRPFAVMPVAHGEPLRAAMDRGPLPVHEAVRLTREVGEALAYLHARGWVHRDVKPENILVEGGHAVLTDFGIAAPVESVTQLSTPLHVTQLWNGRRFTAVGSVMGTLPYVSPESLLGDAPVDPRADVYALGLVLYEMLAGRLPFHADTAVSLMAERMQQPLPALAVGRGGAAALDAVIARATDPDPVRRYPTVTEFVAALGALPSEQRAGRRGRLIVALAALTLVVAAGVAGVWRARAPVYLDPDRIVVADLSDETGDPALANIGALGGSLITASLVHERGLEVIDATMSLGSRQRPRLPAADSSLARATRALVEEAHAGLAVTGAYYREGRQIELLAELIDTRAGAVIGTVGPIAAHAATPERGLQVLADSVAAIVGRHRRGSGARRQGPPPGGAPR